MRNFQDTFKTRKRSFIIPFSICMTVPLKRYNIFSFEDIAHPRLCTKVFFCDKCPMQGFIFIEITETANSFVKIRLVLEIKNVACFIKTCFHWKIGNIIKIWKHAKMFNANKGYKLAIAVFIPTPPFSKYKLVVHFSNVICMKLRPCKHFYSL